MSDKRSTQKNTKSPKSVSSYSTELKTPTKASRPGIAQTVYTHGSTLRSLFNDWRRIKDKGTTLCRSVLSLRLHELQEGDYPEKLGKLVDGLVEASQALESVVESLALVKGQLEAVARLQPTLEPVIGTWSASEIVTSVDQVYQQYCKECALKKYVTENIAHSREEGTIVTMTTAWELEVYVDPAIERHLLADLGVTT